MVFIKVYYGFHGRLREILTLEGNLIDKKDGFLVLLVGSKKHYIEISHILEYEEI
jgi:hypothetical protein